MMDFEVLGGLANRDLVRALYARIVAAEGDPYITFLLSWIILNHLYATYCDHVPLTGGHSGDRHELMHFARDPAVVAARATVLSRHAGQAEVQLPVSRRGRNGRTQLVPHLGNRRVKGAVFTCEEHFEVIYAIRNNVMHGDKAPLSTADRDNIAFAAIHTRDLIERLATIAKISLR